MLTFAKDIPAEILIPEAVMVKNNSSSPTTVPGVAHGFSTQPPVNRPTGAGRVNPGQSARTPQFHIPHGIIKDQPVTGARPKQTKLGASKAKQNSQPTKGKGSAKSGGGGGNDPFEDQCPTPKKEQSQESSTHHNDFIQKSWKKKKRNQHLNQQIEVNGENFEFERDIIKKKTLKHGSDFGLEPDYNPDGSVIRDRKTGKPRVKQNKDNYNKFTENLSEFAKDPESERIEAPYRKERENEQDTIGFLNRREKKFIIFNRNTKKYITG